MCAPSTGRTDRFTGNIPLGNRSSHLTMRLAKFRLCTLLFLGISSCIWGQDAGTDGGGNQGTSEGTRGFVLPENYRIQTSDELSVEVFREPELAKVVRVEGDGSITLPLVGTIQAEGLTVPELRESIRSLYARDYIVNPQIAVTVVSFRLQSVQVLGQVNRSGTVQIPPDEELTLVDAISRSGGFTRLAKRREVTVKRTFEDGSTEVYKVNVDRIMTDPNVEDFVLRDGDVIYVDEILI